MGSFTSSNLTCKSRQIVADEYGISVRTLYRWFKKANINIPPGIIKPFYLKIIYETFGPPKSLTLNLVS